MLPMLSQGTVGTARCISDVSEPPRSGCFHGSPKVDATRPSDPILACETNRLTRAVYHLWYSIVGTIMDETERNKLASSSAAIIRAPISTPPPTTASLDKGSTPIVGMQVTRTLLSPPRPWRKKEERQRLPVFVAMAQGETISPEHTPMPELRGECVFC